MAVLKRIKGGGNYGDIKLTGKSAKSLNDDTGLIVFVDEDEVAIFGDIVVGNTYNPIIKLGKGLIVANSLDIEKFGGDAIQIRGRNYHCEHTRVMESLATRPYNVCIREGKESVEDCLARHGEKVYDPSILKFTTHPSYPGVEIIAAAHVDLCHMYASEDAGHPLEQNGIISNIVMPNVTAKLDGPNTQGFTGSEPETIYEDIHIGTNHFDVMLGGYRYAFNYLSLRNSALGCNGAKTHGCEVRIKEVKTRPSGHSADEVRTANNTILGFSDREIDQVCHVLGEVGCASNNSAHTPESTPKDEPVKSEWAITSKNPFEEFINGVTNFNAPKLTEKDFVNASLLTGLSVRMIKTVARVESLGVSFLPNGLCSALYERHKVHKYAKAAGFNVDKIAEAIGGNLISRSTGGYQGGIAEWNRAEKASVIGSDSLTMPTDEGLEIVLLSMSHGMFQTMGFNYRPCGYGDVVQMVEAYHKSEGEQLQAFCRFIIHENLVRHLVEADELLDAGKPPKPAFLKFARGYNGPAHKNYDVKLARAWREIQPGRPVPTHEPEEIPSFLESRIGQGSTATIVTSVTGGAVAVKEIVAGVSATADKAKETITKVKEAGESVGVDEGFFASLPEWTPWAIILILLIVNAAGGFKALLARIDDRLTGKN